MDSWDVESDALTPKGRRRGCGLAAALGSLVPLGLVGAITLWVLAALPSCGHIFDPCWSPDHAILGAAGDGDLQTVRQELDDGVSPDVRSSDSGSTALGCAIREAHPEVALELLRRGATPGPGDLATAVASGQADVVDALLGAGEAPSADHVVDALPALPCDWSGLELWPNGAARRPRSEAERSRILAALLADDRLVLSDPSDRSPLLVAAFVRDTDSVQALLAAGAPVDEGGPVDAMELAGAAAVAQGRPCTDGLGLLALAPPADGATIPAGSAPDPVGTVPAVGSWTTSTLFPLEQARAGVDNVSPLTAAALVGDVGIATTLLDHGADPNALAGGLVGPLYCAAARGDLGMVQLLLERGATPVPAAPASVLTPSQVASLAGHPELAALLDAAVAPPP